MGTQGMSRKLAEALLSPLQLAQFLGVSRAALKVWREKGTGPKWVRVGGHAVRYAPRDVQAWLEQSATKTVRR